MKRNRTCLHCHESFLPDPRSTRPTGKKGRHRPHQRFCSKPECRQASHRRSNKIYWRKDLECRGRNMLASRAWRKQNRDYWRERRERDKKYTKRNLELQHRRDAKRRGDLANTDTIESFRGDKLERIRFFIRLANTDSSKVSWTLVSEEIRLYLKWSEHLANTNSIASRVVDKPKSPA